MPYSKIKHTLRDEADGQGNDLGGDTKDDAAAQHAEQMSLLTKSVGILAQGLEELRGNQSSITEALAKLAEGTGHSKQEQKEIAQDLFGDDVDMEQLSRKDFAKLIQASIVSAVDQKLSASTEKVTGQVADLASRFESKNASEQINTLAGNNPDFWEWSAEIKQLLQENPTLNVSRAYHLAKAENPDKVAKLAPKYNKPTTKETPFIGLTPTSSRRGAEGTSKMTSREAANKAFDQVMAGLGDVLTNNPTVL